MRDSLKMCAAYNNNNRHKTPLKDRTQTPSRELLSPNDDNFERAQARAARAAASRRKSIVAPGKDQGGLRVESDTFLGKDHILELYQNCIKLASENKINQRNTWELRLIDHLSEIINCDDDVDCETNFQKASCTLEAGVKIYSFRVDSVYSEAFKVLGGLNRTSTGDGHKDTDEHSTVGEIKGADENGGEQREECPKKTSPSLSTLEPSFEALNVKKFDVAFTVDPLYHQTSAQFDEGGAKGLLVNTLSVYNDCRMVFDSWDVPEKSMKAALAQNTDSSSMIDISCVKDFIQQAWVGMQPTAEISPTFKQILKLLDDPFRVAAEADYGKQNQDMISDSFLDDQSSSCDAGPQYFEENDIADGRFDERPTSMSPHLASWVSTAPERHDHEGYQCDDTAEYPVDEDLSSEQTVDFLVLGMARPYKSNAWAGPEHWKYHKFRDDQQCSDATSDMLPGEKKKKKSKREPFTLDFMNHPEIDEAVFAPPKNPRSLLLPQSNCALSTILPEDCHYQPEELVRLFTRPSIMCVWKKGRKGADNCPEASFTWDNGGCQDGLDAHWADGHCDSDVEDTNDNTMIAQPRKVQKIEVDYDKTSKDVDVRILKATLWDCINGFPRTSEADCEGQPERIVSFKKLLSSFPADCPAAALENISVHLCFICLLHLANEHGLKIKDCTNLDDLCISNIHNFAEERD